MGKKRFSGQMPGHGKKNFLAKQNIIQTECFNIGLRAGRQQILNLVSLVLRDPKFVEKDIFGSKRLVKVIVGVGEYMDKYELAWQAHPETDYVRAKLDAALAEAYGPELHNSFQERYEFAPEFDYNRGKWK